MPRTLPSDYGWSNAPKWLAQAESMKIGEQRKFSRQALHVIINLPYTFTIRPIPNGYGAVSVERIQ